MIDSRPRILVIDDGSEVLTELSSQLDLSKYAVATCPLGPVAAEYVAENKPALVLLDAKVLYLRGPAEFERWRQGSPRTRIVFIDQDGPWSLFMDLPMGENGEVVVNPCPSGDVAGVVEQLL